MIIIVLLIILWPYTFQLILRKILSFWQSLDKNQMTHWIILIALFSTKTHAAVVDDSTKGSLTFESMCDSLKKGPDATGKWWAETLDVICDVPGYFIQKTRIGKSFTTSASRILPEPVSPMIFSSQKLAQSPFSMLRQQRVILERVQ